MQTRNYSALAKLHGAVSSVKSTAGPQGTPPRDQGMSGHPVSPEEATSALSHAGVKDPTPEHVDQLRNAYDDALHVSRDLLKGPSKPTKATLIAAAARHTRGKLG